jgi:putative glutamine amidotransferase
VNLRVGVSRWEEPPGETIERYWRRLREAGLDPIDLSGPASDLDGCTGLVLTGGLDIDPSRYGEARSERVLNTDPARDEFEVGLLAAELAADLPVLAICRGHQVLNVALGGSLLQHVSGHAADYHTEGYPSRSHEVTLLGSGVLRDALGADRVVVNSRHHQAVTPERLAPGLETLAVTDDGLVEAVRSERHSWVIGVQWHPEREEPQLPGFAAASARLFTAFATAVTGGRVSA